MKNNDASNDAVWESAHSFSRPMLIFFALQHLRLFFSFDFVLNNLLQAFERDRLVMGKKHILHTSPKTAGENSTGAKWSSTPPRARC